MKQIGPGWRPIQHTYASNNPYFYTDPKGEVAWVDDAVESMLFGMAEGYTEEMGWESASQTISAIDTGVSAFNFATETIWGTPAAAFVGLGADILFSTSGQGWGWGMAKVGKLISGSVPKFKDYDPAHRSNFDVNKYSKLPAGEIQLQSNPDFLKSALTQQKAVGDSVISAFNETQKSGKSTKTANTGNSNDPFYFLSASDQQKVLDNYNNGVGNGGWTADLQNKATAAKKQATPPAPKPSTPAPAKTSR